MKTKLFKQTLEDISKSMCHVCPICGYPKAKVSSVCGEGFFTFKGKCPEPECGHEKSFTIIKDTPPVLLMRFLSQWPESELER